MIFPLVHVLLLSLCGMINSIDTSPPSCIPQTGYISVTSDSDTVNGYMAMRPNEYGGYGTVTNTTEAALRISFCKPEPETDLDAVFEINTLCSVKGYYSTNCDLSATSGNYVYVAGTVSVPRGPAVAAGNSFSNSSSLLPLEPVESFIWTITASDTLLPVWPNSYGSTFMPTLVHYVDPNSGLPLFLLVGDSALFVARFGGQLPDVMFTFVSDTAALQAS